MKQRKQHIFFLWVICGCLLFCTTGIRASNKWEIGVVLGEPTGLSYKSWINGTKAIDAAVAWSFTGEGQLHVHMDYLFHHFKLFKLREVKLPFYYGIGGRVKFEEETRMGLRFPVGVFYNLSRHPLAIFFEVAPILDLIPGTAFNFNVCIGV
ncbi:MAG: hypothetical protein JSV88_00515, partial [Candidatus Aminicenantes bacterium]